MATVTITGGTGDAGALGDNRPWKLWAAVYQSDGTGGVITTRKDREANVLRPVGGVLTFEAEAGIAAYLETPEGRRYLVTIPHVNANLWAVIENSIPPASILESDAIGLRGFPVDDVQRDGNELVSFVKGEEVGRVGIADLLFSGLSVDGEPVTEYDLDTTPVTAADLGAYTIAQTDDAILAALTTPSISTIKDANGNTALTISSTANAVNYANIANAPANNAVQLRALGVSTDIGFLLRPKGSAPVTIYADTGQTPRLVADGADANHNLNLASKGSGKVQANGVEVVTVGTFHALTAKATPTDADELAIVDTAASNVLKKLTIGDLKTLIVALIVGSAPGTLDTLGELADALGDDANYAATITAALALKAPLSAANLTDPKINAIKDVNGSTALGITTTASAVNYIDLANAASADGPQVRALGTAANIAIMLRPKGTGFVQVYAATGATPTIQAIGADANHDLNLVPKGTGRAKVNGNIVAERIPTAPASASATGSIGQFYVDSSYRYDCIAANTWVRGAVATW